MLIPFTQSCLNDYDDDIYDIQAEMPFNAALATVVTPSEVPGEAVIESDNDGIAYVVNPDKLTRFETNNPGQRIFYTYINAANPTGDASKKGPFISIDYLQKILTKPMDTLKENDEDIYGHDGINLITPIMGKTHLTLMFQILGFNSNIKHRISLVATEGTKAVSENLSIQPLSFILPYYYPKFCSLSKNQPHSYVSFLPAAK